MNFINIAKQKNKIKSLSDIKDDYYDYNFYYIYESTVNYNNYIIGDIVFVQRYKYKNGSNGKNHMFLIVDMQRQNQKVMYYGMLISSKLQKASFKYNKFIPKDNNNKLKQDSIIKTDVIYKIFTKNILLKIGNIDKTKVEIYKNYLINNN